MMLPSQSPSQSPRACLEGEVTNEAGKTQPSDLSKPYGCLKEALAALLGSKPSGLCRHPEIWVQSLLEMSVFGDRFTPTLVNCRTRAKSGRLVRLPTPAQRDAGGPGRDGAGHNHGAPHVSVSPSGTRQQNHPPSPSIGEAPSNTAAWAGCFITHLIGYL